MHQRAALGILKIEDFHDLLQSYTKKETYAILKDWRHSKEQYEKLKK